MVRSEIYDVSIIGAGPAGLTASIFAKDKNLNVVVVEGLCAGGQLKNLYPHKPVYNYPGYSQISAGELAERMIKQVRDKEIPLIENAPVRRVTPLEDGSFLVEGQQMSLRARSIILACGMGLFEPRRLEVQGESELEDEGLFYTVDDLSQWENQDVAVFGGGNSALDNALLLSEKKSRVTLIHKLSKFQAEAASVERLCRYNPKIFLGWKTLEFEKAADDKIHAKIENTANGERQIVSFDRILINIGLIPKMEFLEGLNISHEKHRIKVDSEMQTSIPGTFACGDVGTYPGKVRLIVTAIGEAATAVNSLERYLKNQKLER
ncbi:MAG: NAD(P)/FAD-dependent oxidoreductase [bacterium]